MVIEWIDFRYRVLLANLKYLEEKYDAKTSHLLIRAHFARIACILFGIFKIIVGIFSLSIFMIMNGFYTLGMAFSKSLILHPVYFDTEKDELYYCKVAGIVMILSSFIYVIYSCSLIYHPKIKSYGNLAESMIIIVTAMEIFFNTYGIIKYKQYQYVLLVSLKVICLGSSIISAVLAQAILLSTLIESIDLSIHGFLGVGAGVVVSIIGAYLVGRITVLESTQKNKA